MLRSGKGDMELDLRLYNQDPWGSPLGQVEGEKTWMLRLTQMSNEENQGCLGDLLG